MKQKIITLLFILSSNFIFSSCSPNSNHHSDGSNPGGTYQASLVFPTDIPRLESDDFSGSKLINDGINCAEDGIATLTFSFFSADDDPIAGGSWPCEKHEAIIKDIPAGSRIKLEVTAENKSGIALLRGEERDITIEPNQTTEGKDIILYPADSPSIAVGDEPKTLVLDWEHIRFPGNTDHYQLQFDPDGNSGFDTVEGAEYIPDTHYELTIPVHLTDWGLALYRVVAMDAVGDPVGTSTAIDLLTTVAAEDVIGYFKAGNTQSEDLFGESVVLSGDGNILAVAAPSEDSAATGINGDQNDNSADDAGAVYVFARESDGSWRQEAYLKASNAEAGDGFGAGIALSSDGSTLAVGSMYEDSVATGINGDQNDNSAPEAGAIHLFTRSNGGEWRQQAYIKAGNTDAEDGFGGSLALSPEGNTLAVGAHLEDSAATGINGDQSDNNAENTGAIYLFSRNTGGEWQQENYIKASNIDVGDMFGVSVALSGNSGTLAVGADWEDSATGINGDESDNSADRAGAVYLFNRNTGGEWQQEAYIKAGNPDAVDRFGSSVALSTDGNTLSVGAHLEDSAATGINGDSYNNSAQDAGAVYLFTRTSGAEWRQQAYIKAENSANEDRFGRYMALSSDGNFLAVGTPFEDSRATGINNDPDNNDAADAGAAYLFRRNGNGEWRRQAYIKAGNTDSEDHFGTGIALSADGQILAVGAIWENSAATDINGDQDDNSASGAGAVYLY